MTEFIENLMNRLEFPSDAQKTLNDAYDIIFENENRAERFGKNRDIYFEKDDTAEVDKVLDEIAAETGICIYTVQFVFLLFCTERLKDKYIEKGLDEQLFWDLMTDLRCKLTECRRVYGIWGTFVFIWFHRHFRMKLFALGRFQYEKVVFDKETYTHGGITVSRGDTVYNFHIPSSSPITREVRLESYRRAFEFFKERDEKYIVLVCNSWLLYPENRKIFPKNSNLYDFMNDFEITDYETQDGFYDMWRVFGTKNESNFSKLPQDTTLQQNYKKYLLSGGKTGEGYGILIFDGNKII